MRTSKFVAGNLRASRSDGINRQRMRLEGQRLVIFRGKVTLESLKFDNDKHKLDK